MNDPNKAINVNLSSLLSLKAELLRKQAEVNKAKATRTNIDEYVPKKSANISSSSAESNNKKNPTECTEKSLEDGSVIELEDAELLQKSQRVLQAKAKFYERMTCSGGKLNSDDNCLVLFNRKRQEQRVYQEQEHESDSESVVSDGAEEDRKAASESEEDWVEYTDCLGRTRKCLRQDLQHIKQRDEELAASMPERLDQSKANWLLDTKPMSSGNVSIKDDDICSTIGPKLSESVCSEVLTVISKQDEQRATWERKEQENLDKEDVHYQDVFFDEARQHGVGYYAFSTDAEERRRQQRELEETRQQTVTEQEQRDKLRAQREKIIAERVLAAKNRQRARIGLPALEASDLEAEQAKLKEAEQTETKEARKERKRQEKAQRKLEAAEAAREQERQQHIRPWDKQKNSMPTSSSSGFDSPEEEEWSYKPERLPMSQEEWNERQRAERKAEFAPPSNERISESNRYAAELKRVNFTTMPPPVLPTQSPLPLNDAFVSYQSTKRERKFQRRNYEPECNDSEQRIGAAIPPPADLDSTDTRPTHAKRTKSSAELERSIEAGLRFLRHSSDKENPNSKSSWTAKADYQ